MDARDRRDATVRKMVESAEHQDCFFFPTRRKLYANNTLVSMQCRKLLQLTLEELLVGNLQWNWKCIIKKKKVFSVNVPKCEISVHEKRQLQVIQCNIKEKKQFGKELSAPHVISLP